MPREVLQRWFYPKLQRVIKTNKIKNQATNLPVPASRFKIQAKKLCSLIQITTRASHITPRRVTRAIMTTIFNQPNISCISPAKLSRTVFHLVLSPGITYLKSRLKGEERSTPKTSITIIPKASSKMKASKILCRTRKRTIRFKHSMRNESEDPYF